MLFSDSSIAVKTGGCFSADTTVRLADGTSTSVKDLTVGDRVLTMDHYGKLVYDDVILFLHTDATAAAEYVVVETDSGKHLSLTPNHLIYASADGSMRLQDVEPIFAHDLYVGQYVLRKENNSNSVVAVKVVSLTRRTAVGAFAPLTKHGTIVADDVITSCYAVILSQNIAHAALAPVRWYYDIKRYITNTLRLFSAHQHEHVPVRNSSHHVIYDTTGSSSSTYSSGSGGIHWYIELLHSIGLRVIPSSLWFQS